VSYQCYMYPCVVIETKRNNIQSEIKGTYTSGSESCSTTGLPLHMYILNPLFTSLSALFGAAPDLTTEAKYLLQPPPMQS
jgi:hypothetical protein